MIVFKPRRDISVPDLK